MSINNFLKFRDLKRAGIVCNRVTLRRWQERHGFPLGKVIGPNSIGFDEGEVAAWLASRPRQTNTAIKDAACEHGKASRNTSYSERDRSNETSRRQDRQKLSPPKPERVG